MFPFQKTKDDLMIIVLRFAVGSVFLWFGIDKWVHPEAWYDWVASWVWPLSFFSPPAVLMMIGIVEFAVGMLLLVGRQARLVAAAAGAYLLALSFFVGATDVAIRDNALIGCCLAIFIGTNRTAQRPVSQKWVRNVWYAYAIFLFVAGMLFIRHGI